MKKKFIIYLLLFFIPVIGMYAFVEYLTIKLPSAFEQNKSYLEQESKAIEVLVLGSSQMKDAINPALLNTPTINLASGNQHHDTDFKILKEMINRLPNLKTVVLEVSYSHFELPHNGAHFWKNNFYLKYYGVNAFERSTYFKDRLLFASNPPIISKLLYKEHITKEDPSGFNKFGFDTLNFAGRFQKYNYDITLFKEKRFKINTKPNATIFKTNRVLFIDMLEFLEEKNKSVILVTLPMHERYLDARVTEIQQRRDGVLKEVTSRFSNTSILFEEENISEFKIQDFWNESHLNPNGAIKFTALFQKKINTLKN